MIHGVHEGSPAAAFQAATPRVRTQAAVSNLQGTTPPAPPSRGGEAFGGGTLQLSDGARLRAQQTTAAEPEPETAPAAEPAPPPPTPRQAPPVGLLGALANTDAARAPEATSGPPPGSTEQVEAAQAAAEAPPPAETSTEAPPPQAEEPAAEAPPAPAAAVPPPTPAATEATEPQG